MPTPIPPNPQRTEETLAGAISSCITRRSRQKTIDSCSSTANRFLVASAAMAAASMQLSLSRGAVPRVSTYSFFSGIFLSFGLSLHGLKAFLPKPS